MRKVELIIDLKTTKGLGITIPSSLRARISMQFASLHEPEGGAGLSWIGDVYVGLASDVPQAICSRSVLPIPEAALTAYRPEQMQHACHAIERPTVIPDVACNSDDCGDCADDRTTSVNGPQPMRLSPLPVNGSGSGDRPFLRPSAAFLGSAQHRMCMAKWSAEASCWEAAEDPILVTLPTSGAGRTPEGGEHARRPGYGM